MKINQPRRSVKCYRGLFQRNLAIPLALYSASIIVAGSALLVPVVSLAQPDWATGRVSERLTPTPPKPTPSPTPTPPGKFADTWQITPSALTPEQIQMLSELTTLPENSTGILRARKELCTARIAPPPADTTVKAALSLTESDLSADILFERETAANEAPAAPIAISVEFIEESIFLKTSIPRFQSEAGGMLIAPDKVAARTLWLEGKNDASVLAFALPLRTCATRSVVLCPRSFQARSKLIRNGYHPVGIRYYVKTKTDGLFATAENEHGRIRASLLASPGVGVPEKWFDEVLDAPTPSATLKYQRLRSNSPAPEFARGPLPLRGSVESRLDFGKGSDVLRTISKRTTIEVTEFQLPENQRVVVHLANIALEGGSCYLVTKWSETTL